MLKSHIDHLVIVAPSLDAGWQYAHRALGVTPQAGGEHVAMGTHNLLLRLGPTTYLEVIAINPTAPAPARPRWFDLDRLEASAAPRLATWVARTNDIRTAAAASPIALGGVEPMSRGQWNWHITIPADGRLPAEGIAPTLIHWSDDGHPAGTLRDMGCSLIRFEGFHPEARSIAQMLKSVGFDGAFSVSSLAAHEQPHLVAHIQTPGGVRRL